MMFVRRTTVALLLVSGLVGCADTGPAASPAGGPAAVASGTGPSGTGPSGATPSGTGPSDVAPPSDAPVEPSAPPGKPAAGTQTVTGTITAGVEPNCLVLASGGTSYLLIVTDPQLRAAARVGATVSVTGTADPEMVTTCQQGTPLLVRALRAK